MTTTDNSTPTILLVHGAWHGAWCWEALVPELTALGWRVATVDLPSASADPADNAGMYDDARAVRERLAALDGPVTVLAHSYGGLPVTEAVAQAPHVSRLVYLAAFLLDEGVSLAGLSDGQIPSGDSGSVPLPGEPGDILYGGVAPEDADRAVARLVPQSLKSFSEPLTAAGWKTVPCSYIVCEDDKALAPAFQETMALRAERSYRRAWSHSPFLSAPAELAALITADADR
ncbi:alpha/beta fold hydrolase [Streptomyces sp. MI02-7b]|uniref:alpha/beta fold hydrolase n=1 Tax=Streptomyces sp. MI02-7b TaxID=462941 RepID=UPI0029B6AC7B|nr:alpha/beta fold hydrolase [Streptomyces sp. MI02-7b]MDX3076181.1 alpha/beta fold hydrolase [Streptomyces sp. MI02-7b]